MSRNRVLVAAFLMSALGLAGCANGDSTNTASGPKHLSISGSRIKSYDTLKAVRADSVAVARVKIASQRSVEDDPTATPYTLSTASVERSVPRGALASTIVIRQLGTTNTTSDDLPPVFSVGGEYIVFLQVFHFEAGDSTGQYIVTGPAGQYALEASGKFKRQDPISTALPDEADETTLYNS